MDYTNSEMRKAIDECIHNDMYRKILRLRMIDGWTYERIAEKVNRTPRHVNRIVKNNLPMLREKMS